MSNCKALGPDSSQEVVLHQGSGQKSESMHSCMRNVPSKVVGFFRPPLDGVGSFSCLSTHMLQKCSVFKRLFHLPLDHGLVPCMWSLAFGVWAHALHSTISSDGQGRKIEVVPLFFDISGSW